MGEHAGSPPAAGRGDPASRKVSLALFAAGVAVFGQMYAPQAVLSLVADDFGLSPSDSSLLISATTLGVVVGVLPWSYVSDRIGRIPAMRVALIGATVLGLAIPFIPSFAVIVVLRGLAGLLLAGLPAVALTYISEELHSSKVGAAAGTMVAGNTIGGLLGRIVVGFASDLWGWRVGMLCASIFAGLFALIFFKAVPAVRISAELAPRYASPSLLLTFRNRRLIILFVQSFLLIGGFILVYNYLGFRLAAPPFSLSPDAVSLVFLAYLAGTFSSHFVWRAADRFSPHRVFIASVVTMVAGLLLSLTMSLALIIVGVVVLTGACLAAISLANGSISRLSPGYTSQAASVFNLFYYGGAGLVGWLGGYAYAWWDWSGAVLATIVLAAVAGVLVVVGSFSKNCGQP